MILPALKIKLNLDGFLELINHFNHENKYNFLLITIFCQSQSDDILGIWLEEEKQSKIEIYKKIIVFLEKLYG